MKTFRTAEWCWSLVSYTMQQYPLKTCLVSALGVLLCICTAVTLATAEPNLMPDEVLHRLAKYMTDNPKGNSADFVKSLLPHVNTINLDPDQEVTLGMVYYFAFMPKEASERLGKYLDRNDRLGRVSWQADERMLAAAFQKDEEAERRIPEFRRRFKPVPEDLLYSEWLIWDAAEYHREKGEFDKAVKIMLDDLHDLPLDMPYETYDVLGSQYECFKKTGLSEVAINLMVKHRDALRGRLAKAHADEEQLAASKISFDFVHKPGVEHFYFWLDGPLSDDPRFSREQIILRKAASDARQLDRWISQAQAGSDLLK